MIIKVKESVYKGILLKHVKDKGWKCNLGGQMYLFPHYTAAQAAIDEIFADIKPIITKRKGEKIAKEYDEYKVNPLNAILEVLKDQKKVFQEKEYEYAEELLDALIAELEA